MRKRVAASLLGGLLILSLAACSGAATPTPQAAAEQAACDALSTWATAIHDLQAMDPSTASIDDVKAQATKVQDDWDALKTSLQAVTTADEAALETAWTGLSQAIDAIPTDQPVSTVIDGLKTAAAPIKDAYTEIANGMGCPQVNPLQ